MHYSESFASNKYFNPNCELLIGTSLDEEAKTREEASLSQGTVNGGADQLFGP